MNLTERINQDLKAAMIAKDTVGLRGIRAIKSAIMIFNTSGTGEELNSESEIKIIQKLIKQRKDSLEIFVQQNRPELASIEEEEIVVIEKYLPVQLSSEELESFVTDLIKELGAAGMKDMGKVMGAANGRLAGKADGKSISEMVKKLLA